jgi:hypothetical protein
LKPPETKKIDKTFCETFYILKKFAAGIQDLFIFYEWLFWFTSPEDNGFPNISETVFELQPPF